MLNNILAVDLSSNWVMLVILGGFFVLMMVMTILPQKKRQKQMQEMMAGLVVGTKVMTIGRMIGKIVSIDTSTNQIILNVGTEENPTLITIDKAGIGYVMDKIESSNNIAAVSDSTANEKKD